MTTSHDATPTNCFSSVFRRLLCAGGLPTHPSTDTSDNPKDQTTHLRFKTDDASFKIQSPSPTRTTIPAGIVARLMGLDSFPTSTRSTQVSLATIMRSRSPGSVDFFHNFEIKKQPHDHNYYQHRRVRTSVSFREVPTFLKTLHNHDLGKLDDRALGKSEMMGLTPKQEKSKNLKKRTGREREREKMSNKKGQSQSMKVKKEEEEEVSSVKFKYRRNRRENAGKKKVVDDGFPDEHKYKSRKRTYNHLLPKMVKHDRKAKKQSMLKTRESKYSTEEYCMKVLVNVCRLTMEEINGGVWVDTKVDNNIQEISYEVGQEILQLLLYEMVDELCSFQ